MSDANTPEPIDPTSPNHCRPADHPEHLHWPPIMPDDYQARVELYVKRHERSRKAFHYDLAAEAFGGKYMESLLKNQKEFQGDWFQLALLLRCHETSLDRRGFDDIYKKCLCIFCQFDWKWTIHLENAKLNDAQLENVFLLGAHLENVELNDADLEKAFLIGVNLENAQLRSTNLENANLFQARLKNTNFMEARLENAAFTEAQLENACFFLAHLKNANLLGARLKNADLKGTFLENATLCLAHLENANLEGANLTGANLEHTVLDRANVRKAKGIIFDSTQVDCLRIEGNAPDPWSVLRRSYTGPMFFFHLTILTAFLLPYIGKAIVLTGISESMDLIDAKLAGKLDDIPPELQQLQGLHQLRDWWDGMDRKTAMWTLLGFTNYKIWTMIFFGLTLMMIAYNAFRYILTTKVSDLREAEERSKITPPKKEYLGLYRLHQIATVFMYVSYGALIIQIVRWLWVTQIPTY